MTQGTENTRDNQRTQTELKAEAERLTMNQFIHDCGIEVEDEVALKWFQTRCHYLQEQLLTRPLRPEGGTHPNPDGHTCDFCKWTNMPSNLNIGGHGKPLWICHGCVKRLYEKSARPEGGVREERRDEFIGRMIRELEQAYNKHGNRPWTRHEFYAILKEEVDELWDAIKRDAPIEEIEKEMIQVSAMPLRFFETSLLPPQEGKGE